MTEEEREQMELSHEPVPGYPAAFYIVVAAALGYLIVVFGASL